MMTSNKKLLSVLGFASMLAACSEPAPPPQAPPAVVVASPLTATVADWDDYSGRFEAVETVEVRPRVSGAIQSIHFRDGERVQKGQLLFSIDPRPYAAALARAKAQVAGARAVLSNADAELKRAQTLVESRLISVAQADLRAADQQQAAASLAAAEAELATHELNLSFTRVVAPITGRASYRRLAAGNIVTADTTVLTNESIGFILESALARRVPVIGFSPEFTRLGALLSLSVSYGEVGRETGVLAKRILEGDRKLPAKPIPVERLKITVNLKTARFLGIEFPKDVNHLIDETY